MATMSAIQPGSYGFPVNLKKRYDNFIGGEWVAPLSGQYFENVTPVTGQVLCDIARSNAAGGGGGGRGGDGRGGTPQSRFARRWRRICRWRSTTSAILRA